MIKKSKMNLRLIILQQTREYKRHGSALIRDEKFMYVHKDIITPIIMHCRVSIPKSIEFKFKLGLEQRIGGLSKEQSFTIIIMKSFPNEKISIEHNVLNYFIDCVFHSIN